MSTGEHQYSKDGVTVIWKPSVCIHSARCVLGLGSVFNPQAHPWVNMEGAPVERIAQQVKKCPSGALSLSNEIPPAK
jgi:uncharacterized Fe-S cluster protein YjdI